MLQTNLAGSQKHFCLFNSKHKIKHNLVSNLEFAILINTKILNNLTNTWYLWNLTLKRKIYVPNCTFSIFRKYPWRAWLQKAELKMFTVHIIMDGNSSYIHILKCSCLYEQKNKRVLLDLYTGAQMFKIPFHCA